MDSINFKKSISGINNDERLRQHMSRIEIPQEEPKKRPKFSKSIKIFLGILFLIIVFIIIFFIFSLFKNRLKNDWQAVFLTNNEVYFGKIINKNKYEIILKNIYYLKETVALQQGIEGLNKQTGDFTLIKLGISM